MSGERPETREAQYNQLFDLEPVTLGPMAGGTWRMNPRRLGFVLARYKFVAQMVKGLERVAEIGCSDGFASVVVRDAVKELVLYDFDPVWVREASKLHPGRAAQLDILCENDPVFCVPRGWFDAVFMCDVIEHIRPEDEPRAIVNIMKMLKRTGFAIFGAPSLESQAYASEISKAGHVNCRSGDQLRSDMLRYFDNVLLFGMNDEVLHTGFPQMCHYLFALCTGPKR